MTTLFWGLRERLPRQWLNIPQPWVLSIDRTNWSFGSHHYNILTVGIVHEGVAMIT